MKSSVDNDCQFELDALGCSEALKTGESICNMLRTTKTGDGPSCRVKYRLVTVKQTGRELTHVQLMYNSCNIVTKAKVNCQFLSFTFIILF